MKRFVLIGAALLLAGMVVVLAAPKLLVNPGPLLAGHSKLDDDCFECHVPLAGPTDGKCIACHPVNKIGVGKPDGVPFHQGLMEQQCLACHTDHVGREARKAIAAFDHQLLQPVWRTKCQNCHRKPTDNLHRAVAAGCDSCHATAAWKPATFDHARYFRFDRDHPPDCLSCHVGGDYKRYTCYACHEHEEADVRAEHREEGIFDIEKCTDCHRSGDEDEAKRLWRQRRSQSGDPANDRRRREDDDDD